VAHTWGEPVTADGAMVVAGSTNLFQYPELVRDQLQSLVKTFEEKRLLMALMEEVRQSPGLQVFVGKNVPVLGREALAGDLLFDPTAGQFFERDEDHLAQMQELLGPMPLSVALRGKRAAHFFTPSGELRNIRALKFWGPAHVLTEK
jgi:hypothetical protein